MEISRSRALRGPNLWSRNTAIESIVHCTPEEHNFTLLPRFEEKLRARFPAIGGLQAQGMANTLSLAHVLEAAALALQAQAGCPVTFSRTQATVEQGTFQVVVEYTEEAVGKRAVELAEALINAALTDSPFDAKAAIAELYELDEEERVGPSTGSLLNASIARGIPTAV